MSKFVDKLHNLSKSSASPIGFHAAASKLKSSPMLLVAGLAGVDVKEADALTDSNVDAGLILNQNSKVESLKEMVKAMGDIPLGVVTKGMSKKRAAELVDSGCDFVVFDMKASVAALRGEGAGKFLVIEPSLDQGLVRAINALEVDGVFINRGRESFITVEYLLICRRFSELLDKPLVVTLPSLITSAELGNLWEAGMDGIVIPPAQPVEAFTELRKVIDNLPKRAKHRRGKVGVVLPHYGGDIAAEEEEEEEI
ncbi:MAG: hypothetical protein KAV98_04805 [Dehalococcoidia bacterium]|nr:hypothetical protein [Dehalococcoidia bacterium]